MTNTASSGPLRKQQQQQQQQQTQQQTQQQSQQESSEIPDGDLPPLMLNSQDDDAFESEVPDGLVQSTADPSGATSGQLESPSNGHVRNGEPLCNAILLGLSHTIFIRTAYDIKFSTRYVYCHMIT